MTQRYQISQLDAETRQYLATIQKANGTRMPGVYCGAFDGWPIVSLVAGLVIVPVTLMLTLPPTESPVREAFLQTAGMLLGCWLILAAIRLWMANAAGTRLGSFTYVDSEYLYEVDGNNVAITDIQSIRDANVTQNMSEGSYKNSDVTIKLQGSTKTFTINSEAVGRRLAVYLNALAYMRSGGEDGTETNLQELTPYEMSTVAYHIAKTGNFPKNLAELETVDIADVPRPNPVESGGASGLIGYLGVFALGATLFIGFLMYNKSFREDVIYNRITALPLKEQPPALRMYLSNDEFQKHRVDAQNRLDQAYSNAATTFIRGNDAQMSEAIRLMFLKLPSLPQPVVSLAVIEDSTDPNGKSRQDSVSFELADKLSSTLGDELISFARLENTTDVKSMIELKYKIVPNGTSFTLTFRYTPDEAPYKTIVGIVPKNQIDNFLGNFTVPGLSDYIVRQSCGLVVMRPQIPIGDDF